MFRLLRVLDNILLFSFVCLDKFESSNNFNFTCKMEIKFRLAKSNGFLVYYKHVDYLLFRFKYFIPSWENWF